MTRTMDKSCLSQIDSLRWGLQSLYKLGGADGLCSFTFVTALTDAVFVSELAVLVTGARA